MRCLEKDRPRRYETASALARDIERHLCDEAVEACPPSAAYRLRKFARKNRVVLSTAAAFLAMLAITAGVRVCPIRAVNRLSDIGTQFGRPWGTGG
jgi:eukaryotic-like serine/threonine-protein kinase